MWKTTPTGNAVKDFHPAKTGCRSSSYLSVKVQLTNSSDLAVRMRCEEREEFVGNVPALSISASVILWQENEGQEHKTSSSWPNNVTRWVRWR